jgi:hypothetical protein
VRYQWPQIKNKPLDSLWKKTFINGQNMAQKNDQIVMDQRNGSKKMARL